MTKKIASVILLSLIGLMLFSCRPSRLQEPGGRPEDAYAAITDPDEYAWKLFFFINHPAKPGLAGTPDLKKKFGDFDPNGSFVWETWALASGDKNEVFLPNGESPGKWEDLPRSRESRVLTLSKNMERQMMFEEIRHKRRVLRRKGTRQSRASDAANKEFLFTLERPEQEIRMNRAAFEGIVKQEMYSADGLENLLQSAKEKKDPFIVRMDSTSKEVKAEWLPLTNESWKQRYIWREGPPGPDGKRQAYALVALHITTKDLHDWFWADFGHVDCEEAKNACSTDGYAMTPGTNDPIDSTTRGPRAAHGVNGIRAETVGTVWENYILRGTQTGFVKSDGEPTVLSNPVVESAMPSSSCITCHAYATVGPRNPQADGMDRVTNLGTQSDPGVPDPGAYRMDPKNPQSGIKYLQTDFMWAPVRLANRRNKSLH